MNENHDGIARGGPDDGGRLVSPLQQIKIVRRNLHGIEGAGPSRTRLVGVYRWTGVFWQWEPADG